MIPNGAYGVLFRDALTVKKSADELREIAAAFETNGKHVQAVALRRLADRHELPDSVKCEQRAAFHAAMVCDDVEWIRTLVLFFETNGALFAARALRRHAREVSQQSTRVGSKKP